MNKKKAIILLFVLFIIAVLTVYQTFSTATIRVCQRTVDDSVPYDALDRYNESPPGVFKVKQGSSIDEGGVHVLWVSKNRIIIRMFSDFVGEKGSKREYITIKRGEDVCAHVTKTQYRFSAYWIEYLDE